MIVFKKISATGKYQDDRAIPDLISYICRPDKTPSRIIGGVYVDPNNIAASMVAVSERFHKNSRVRLHHFIISFEQDKSYRLDMLTQVAEAICNLIGKEFQIVYALHEDTENLHFHFVFNAVSYVDGHKFHMGIGEYHSFVHSIEKILSVYCLYPLIPITYHPDPNDPNE